ncbi:MAG: hypothetical protein GXO17_02635 [Thermodesulfobacteria bacterium]|nr:hypothetical protein [Thermodesulfobacteriota bacterium]
MPQLNLDCEGPLTVNDNAFELCAQFIPRGDRFFALVSKYDDYLADVEKRPGYKAGDTLKLILPFLKAHGITNETIREFSKKTLKVLRGAIELLRFASRNWPTFIISTSYCPYLEALCEISGFPMENVFCTRIDLDRLHPSEKELRLLRDLAQEIADLPMIEIPEGASRLEDLPPESRETIRRLEEIFWKVIPGLETGRFLEETNPVGGREKARAVEESLARTGNTAEEVLYVGDSITDVEAFELVRKARGGSVSFNGNRYALRSAEFFALAPQAASIACLMAVFDRDGREGLLREAEKGLFQACKALPEDLSLWAEEFRFGKVGDDFEALVKESEAFRRRVRGEAIGALG